MYRLLIDTHDKYILLCLYKDNNVVDKRIKASAQQHSDFVMPLLDELISSNGIKIHDIGEIIVVNGPGSFTGVRIGVTIAKMLAYTLNVSIKTITSLEMYAVSSETKDNKLILIRDIKGAYGAVFNKDDKIIKEYFYLGNEDLNTFISSNNYNVYENVEPDLEKIISLANNKESIHPHAANPIYIKVIEALKNDKTV